MSVLVDRDTRLVVTGITGREGTFHATNNKRYGTQVVAGVTPGKGGQDVDGIPVFNTIREAVDKARAAGDSVSALHIKHIFPLPSGLENIFSGFNHVLVVEINDEGLYGYGQLGGLLRARYCDPKIRGITKTDGLTWKVRDIIERAKGVVNTGVRKM